MHKLSLAHQIDNLKHAREIITPLRNEQLSPGLSAFANDALINEGPTASGAQGDLGGWIAKSPYFADLQININDEKVLVTPWTVWSDEVSEYLFGDKNMFAVMPDGATWDEREEVLRRIENQLRALGA